MRKILKENITIDFDDIDFIIALENYMNDGQYEFDTIWANIEALPSYYIDDRMNSNTNKVGNTMYLIANTGLTKNGKCVLCSFIYNKNSNHFYGGYFGSAFELFKKNSSYCNVRDWSDKAQRFNNKILADKVEINVESSVVHDISTPHYNKEETHSDYDSFGKYLGVGSDVVGYIFDNLLINNWKSKDGLDRYLKIIGTRIGQLVEDNDCAYYIMNNVQSVIVNTGLLDKYNNDILVLYKWYVTPGCYKVDKIVESKREVIDENFEDVGRLRSIKPISFGADLYLHDVTIDDFDVTQRALEHILLERRDRFDDDIRNLPLDILADKINSSLNTGVKMLNRDSSYARPSYSGKSGKMYWLLPLHINKSFSDEPELVMVISKEKYYYEIKTILEYDDAIKDRVTAMELYRRNW